MSPHKKARPVAAATDGDARLRASSSSGQVTAWPDPYVTGHGSAAYVVEHYELDLTYKVGPNRLDGNAVLTVVPTVDLAHLRLDLIGLKVSSVKVGRGAVRWRQKDGGLNVHLGRLVSAGSSLRIEIVYSGNPSPQNGTWGDTGWEELDDGVLVADQPDGAPTWFPCNDFVGAKSTYGLTFTTDADYTVVASSPATRVTRRASTRTWFFERTEPTCTYLMSVQVGRYDVVPLGARSQVARPADIAGDVDRELERHEELFGVFERAFGPYPFTEYTLVVTPDRLEIPLETHAGSVFGSNHFDRHHVHADRRLIAHELAHQWFGNSVSVAGWRDVWLNEGFACYAEWIWSQAASPDDPDATTDALARSWHRKLSHLPQDIVVGDPGPDDMFDDRVYKRGALTLHAVRLTIGDALFARLLTTWTDRYRHSSATTDDLRSLVAELVGDDSLEPLFERWLFLPELPDLPEAASPSAPAAVTGP